MSCVERNELTRATTATAHKVASGLLLVGITRITRTGNIKRDGSAISHEF